MRHRVVKAGALALAAVLSTTVLGSIPSAMAVASGTVAEVKLPIPDVTPVGLAAGPDGSIWFGENSGSAVGRIDPAGTVTEFALPINSQKTMGSAEAVAIGSGGVPWFTDAASDVPRVGKIDPATGIATLYELPTTGEVSFAGGQITSITAGPDGAMWFAGGSSYSLGRIDSSGTVTAFAMSDYSTPYAVTIGPDHLVWFTDDQNGGVGRFDPATGNLDTYYPPSAGKSPGLGDIVAGPDGGLWFTEPGANKIGRIDPATGNIAEYGVSTTKAAPDGITVGADGNLWFTESAASNVGRITPSGAVTEYPLPSTLSTPMRITKGPGGKLIFTESGRGVIGQLDPNAPPSGSPNPATPSLPYRPDVPSVTAPFANQCPLMSICQTQVTTGGSVKIGSFSQQLPAGTIRVTGSLPNASADVLQPPVTGQQFVAQPVEVKGGLIGQLPLVGPILGMTPLAELQFNKLTISQSLVGPIKVSDLGQHVEATLNIQLNNQLLGTSCVIGPITANLGPKYLINGASVDPHLGWNSFPISINSAIAVPAAKGCGPFGILDPIINQMMGLPSSAANNTMSLTGILNLGIGINPSNTSVAARASTSLSPTVAKLVHPQSSVSHKGKVKAPKKVTKKVKGITKKLQVR
jgi:streptogramin lyase